MKKNPVIPILSLVFLVLMVIAIILDIKKVYRVPKERDFPSTIIVATTSDLPYIIQYSKTIAYDILEFNNVVVQIGEIPAKSMPIDGEITIDAYVVPADFVKHTYTIFLSADITTDTQLRRVLSHEFAHIKQFEEGRLVMNKNITTWEGDTVTFEKQKWSQRPWEIDAKVEGRRINKQLDSFLY